MIIETAGEKYGQKNGRESLPSGIQKEGNNRSSGLGGIVISDAGVSGAGADRTGPSWLYHKAGRGKPGSSGLFESELFTRGQRRVCP